MSTQSPHEDDTTGVGAGEGAAAVQTVDPATGAPERDAAASGAPLEHGPAPGEAPERDSPPRTVLVLGGGGLKGLAHIGAWRALLEHGIRVDAIVGTSIGALIGALIAGGVDVDAVAEKARELEEDDILQLNRWVAWIRGVKQSSVYQGERYREYIRRVLPVERWDEFRIPLRMNAVSLATGRTVWFGDGARTDVPPAEAIYASGALPLYFPPLPVDGPAAHTARSRDGAGPGDGFDAADRARPTRDAEPADGTAPADDAGGASAERPGDYLVDGALRDTLALDEAARWGAERIIAVDVSAEFEAVSVEPYLDQGLIGLHQRVMEILGEKERRMEPAWQGPELIRVRPEIGHLGTFDFGHAEFAMEQGHTAAERALREWRARRPAPAASATGGRTAIGATARRWLDRAARALPGLRSARTDER